MRTLINAKSFERYFVGAVVILYAAFWIYVTLNHGAAVPPGDDSNFHLKTIRAILDGKAASSPNYPVGFHYLAAGLSWILNVNPVKLSIGIFALLLPLSSLALYFSCRALLGRTVALITFALYTLISFQPMQTLYDGGLPNVLAAGILLPLFFVCYLKFLELAGKERWRYAAFSLLLALFIFLTHHLSALYLTGVVVVATPLLTFFAKPGERRTQLGWFGVVTVVGIGALIMSGAITPTVNLVRQVVSFAPTFPFISLIGEVQDPGWIYRSYRDYKEGIGPTLVILGSLYPLAFLVLMWKRQLKRAHVLILIWLLLLLIASRLSGLGVPARAAKDMALPLSMAGGVLVAMVWQERSHLWRLVAVAATVWVLIVGGIDMTNKFVRIDDLTRMFRVTKADEQLLRDVPAGSHVAVYGISQLLSHLRPEVKFTNLHSQQETPLNVWLGEFDYVIVEMGEWPHVPPDEELLRQMIESPELKIVRSASDRWKTLYLFEVRKN
ncbi:MAG: hypothetical protein HZB70_03225 [Candidatus Berkelbacteria bacterium]|nr:MAG: hypothetical protein HZB70_03225 [Candidatus Berkelbacteria bacterium]QQG51687.1 MAG: hypothetical protein HY845_03965 [Candidatus Berkelbacteria bacterium]